MRQATADVQKVRAGLVSERSKTARAAREEMREAVAATRRRLREEELRSQHMLKAKVREGGREARGRRGKGWGKGGRGAAVGRRREGRTEGRREGRREGLGSSNGNVTVM